MIEKIVYNKEEYAIIIRNNYNKDGVNFITPDNYSQQLAYMKHPAGKDIEAHVHNPVKREVQYTNEVLFIKKGKLRVDFYNEEYEYQESRILEQGDLILLIKGGHGFQVLEDLEMIEVKQGPYTGDNDKTKFKSKIERVIIGGENNE